MIFDPAKEGGILNQGYLDGFDNTGSAGELRLSVEKGKIIDDGVGNGERADEVFFAVGIDAVFYAHATIVLGEHGGGKAH